MKKLYQNIERINIKGDISQLSEVVRTIDISLQNITDYTDRLTVLLLRFSSSNKGAQFGKVVKTCLRLRDELFLVASELNEMQNQVVAFQNKIYRYEERAESAFEPNPFLAAKRQISTDQLSVRFDRVEMMQVVAALKNYKERVFYSMHSIEEKKNNLANVWLDNQYGIFSAFVDDVIKRIEKAIEIFDEYVIKLEERIKEL